MSYNLGDKVRVTGTIEQTDGTNIDPTQVYGWYRDPDDTLTTYHYGVGSQLVRSAAGVYYMDIDTDTAGIWYYGFYSTGTGKAASSDGTLTVETSQRI